MELQARLEIKKNSVNQARQASLEIRDLNTAFIGKDFALDDMSHTAVNPDPSATVLVAGFAALRFVWKRRGS